LLGGAIDVPESVEIMDLTLDSRTVRPGAAFLACRGHEQHGLIYAQQAAAAGARAILWEPAPGVTPPRLDSQVLLVAVPDLRQQAGFIADRFFSAPSAQLAVAGITGTNGKSTCAWLLADALSRCGKPAAYFGTLGHGQIGALDESSLTTPDAVTLQRWLAEALATGARAVAMEVSSHALDQHRCAGVRFHSAALTNLTRDHLDYHGDMEAYAAAKASLFDWPTLSARVLNIDDAFGREMAARLRDSAGLWVTSSHADTELPARARFVRARNWRAEAPGVVIEIESSAGAGMLRAPLIGSFNVDNLLTVIAVLLGLDVSLADACAALEMCTAPPGRMQTMGGGGLPLVVLDYAHTPDALQQALTAARAHASGKLGCVFGCGGDRDAGKRPLMGRIAATLADYVYVTDDNPRGEDPAAITRAIVAGMPESFLPQVVHDRRAAIGAALADAAAGDVVLIAGKGHENYQLAGGTRRPFSDLAVAREVLATRGAA
jgi:UDP-N-acetylmuramoyl-L-alanyl-D-glutamate--2,6-diaminopimelate ligase